ncbi:MAG: transglutaminase family protein [Candidatus Thiodiazotropha sp. L084R]
MQRYTILHRTFYNFPEQVRLGPHWLRLRPREGHELRIESSSLEISPPAKLRWLRDAEDNSVIIATFDQPVRQLMIESNVIIQQYNEAPLDFLVSDYAVEYPFEYTSSDLIVLAPYLKRSQSISSGAVKSWIDGVWKVGEKLQSYELLLSLTRRINQTMRYQIREEPGVQSAEETLALGSGSCRDFATLLLEGARELGFAARFVSGYLDTPPSPLDYGATHAWTEVYLPGPGWKGFDPTVGDIVGGDHVSVAVSHSPSSVPPVEGSYVGPAGAQLEVGVWMTPI